MLAINRPSPFDPLYKYQSLANCYRVCQSISENYLYWGDPTKFNDPFDCRTAYIFEGSQKERRAIRMRAANAMHPEKSRRERRLSAKRSPEISDEQIIRNMKLGDELEIGEFGICCLSDCSDNILMWSHYAGNHAGICLGFSPSIQATDFASAMKVNYSRLRPITNLMHSIKGENFFDATFLTKAEQWNYESEWRMIERNITERRRPYPPSALAEVIFGARIKPDDRAKILSAIEASGATPKLLKAEIDETRFQINLVEL